MINSIPNVYNKVTGTASSEFALQVASAPAVPEKNDSFKKSIGKMLAATSAATIGGGVIGAIFAKMTEATRKIPDSILKKYNLDFGKYGSARAKIETQVLEEEFILLLKSITNKLLNNEELTHYELELAKKIDLEPNMVKFLDSAKKRAKWLLNLIDLYSYSPESVFEKYSDYSPTLEKNYARIHYDVSKWLNSIIGSDIKYSNNEEFLDYVSSELFKNITFKIKYDKNGAVKDFVTNIEFKKTLDNGDTLSDATYTFKELVDIIIAKKDELKTNFDFCLHKLEKLLTGIITNPDNGSQALSGQKLSKCFEEFCNTVTDKIKAYNNKQILKSAGIGALVTGAIALCAALIYRKFKEKEQ